MSEDEGSDEDYVEELAIPSEWNTYQFDNIIVDKGFRVPWEYDQNEIRQRAISKCKEVVQEAVKFWVLSLQHTSIVVKSNPRCYNVKCVIKGCPWRVHAFHPK